MIKRCIGIDPGIKGAFALIEEHSRGFHLVDAKKMPLIDDENRVDVRGIAAILAEWNCPDIFLERAQASTFAFGSGSRAIGIVSAFTMGYNYSRIETVLELNNYSPILVTPRTWTALLHKGIEGDNAKAKSSAMFLSRCTRHGQMRALFRHSKRPHEGVIDASLVAWWGLLNRM